MSVAPSDAAKRAELSTIVGAAISYLEDPADLTPGNTIRLLRDGREAYPAWLAAIASARARISMEMYIFAADRIGHRFKDALVAAARRGVTVRLLYDFIGCLDTPTAFFGEMRDAGAQVMPYHEVRGWRPRFWTLFRRNHRKTLVIDGECVFTGGLNVADDWQPVEEGGADWRDASVEIRGPATRVAESIFARTWNRGFPRRARKKHRFDLGHASFAPAGATPIAVVANRELRDRFAIRRAALHAIRASRTRVLLANPYFVPDLGILHALRRAAERGVDVRVLLPAAGDSRFMDWAIRASFPFLLRHGIRVFQHPHVVHSKVLTVDDVFASIGSYNLDHRSLTYNLEMVANTVDVEHGLAVRAMLESEMAQAREVTAENFARRPFYARLLERLAYFFRKWL